MPWSVLKWYLTQNCSPASLTHWKVWEPKPSMWRQRRGDAAVAEQPGDLVGRLGGQAPEVPDVVRLLRAGVRVALLGVDEVGELDGVADEEHRGVVADEVVVALFGVELQREAAGVAHRVGGAEVAGHGREAQEGLGLLAHLGEEVRLGVLRDVGGHGEGAVGAGAAGVDHALGDALAVEVRELLEQHLVLDEQGPADAGGLALVVVGDRRAGLGGQRPGSVVELLAHGKALSTDSLAPAARPLTESLSSTES